MLPLLLLAACRPSDRETYFIRGSDTEVNLVLSLGETFMDRHPDVSLAISGGGSGTGITSLINGKTDLANSSREMRDEELELARQRGVEPLAFIFAVDGIAVVVHESNPLPGLSLDQLGTLYRGDASNWSQVGGPDREITLYGRQSNSGTYVFFQQTVVRADFSPQVRQMNGTAQIVEAVRQDPTAIGYVGVGYLIRPDGSVLDGLRIVPLAAGEGEPPLSPTSADAIRSGRYPLSRPLYQFTDGPPQGLLLEFLQFETSDEGQAIVEREGYFAISPDHHAHNRRVLGIDP